MVNEAKNISLLLAYRFFGFRFVMERSLHAISVWFWPRNDPWVPLEIKFGGSVLDSRRWVIELYFYGSLNRTNLSQGIPAAYFPNTSCDFSKHFAENNIIINLTFCMSCLISFF